MTKMQIYPTDYQVLIEAWPGFYLKNLKVDKCTQVRLSNKAMMKNLTLIRLYGLRSCEAFTYILLSSKDNLLLNMFLFVYQ